MYKKIIFFTCLLIGEMEAQSSKCVKKNKITKLYHHKSDLQDRLVMYFYDTPDCLYIPSRAVVSNNNKPVINEYGMTELTYFFPLHGVKSKDIEKYNAKIKDMAHEDYQVAMHYDRNKDGVVVKISFMPEKIGFQYESFSAITGEPALSFAFFKRNALDDLHLGKSLFNTACSDKKKL